MIWVIILRRTRWVGYVASIPDGRIILRWIFRKWDQECTGLIWLRIGMGARQILLVNCKNRYADTTTCAL
jgi:hypothetical protein